jgi:hypothetical protein
MTEDGSRNLYELDLRTLDEVRRYLDRFTFEPRVMAHVD